MFSDLKKYKKHNWGLAVHNFCLNFLFEVLIVANSFSRLSTIVFFFFFHRQQLTDLKDTISIWYNGIYMTELNLNNFSLLPQPYLAFIWSIHFFKKATSAISWYDHREPTLLFVKCKFKSSERWKLNLFCSWICCGGAKRNGSCSTMQKRCSCRRYIRKFHNALFYVVCLAFHCWLLRRCYYHLSFHFWLLTYEYFL